MVTAIATARFGTVLFTELVGDYGTILPDL